VPERQTGTTIAWAQTPKGPEPHGRSRRYPTPRVLHRQRRLGGLPVRGSFRSPVEPADSLRRTDLPNRPKVPWRALTASAARYPKGRLRCAEPTSVGESLRRSTTSRASARDLVKPVAGRSRARIPSGTRAEPNRGLGLGAIHRDRAQRRAIRLHRRRGLAPPTRWRLGRPPSGARTENRVRGRTVRALR